MTTDLRDAEIMVARDVCRRVCEGAPGAAVLVRTTTHAVVGFAMELSRHPSGFRRIPPPVICAFDRQAWLRIAVMCKAMDR